MSESHRVGRWTAQTWVDAYPDDVLMFLTEPGAITRWAPVPFEVVGWGGERLSAGENLRVRGRLAGRVVEFEVEVDQADYGRLVLTATGPVRLDVDYEARAMASGSELRASIAVSGRGLRGRVLAQAIDALLASGALDIAVDRLAQGLEPAFAA